MMATIWAPWFGPLPFYADHFIKCCGRAPQINFIVHSDQTAPYDLPANVHWFLVDCFNSKVSEFLGRPVVLRNAHKLCDLKPFWHQIFNEPRLPVTQFIGWIDWDVVHDLSLLPYTFTSAKFTRGLMASPLFLRTRDAHITLWPQDMARFLYGDAHAWDERTYLPRYNSTFFQDGMTPGVDLIGPAPYAVHMYYEKQNEVDYQHAAKFAILPNTPL